MIGTNFDFYLLQDTKTKNYYIYGSDLKGAPFLKQFGKSTFWDQLFQDLVLNEIKLMPTVEEIQKKIASECPIEQQPTVEEIKQGRSYLCYLVYNALKNCNHVQKRPGYSRELCRVLQHVDVDHADLQPIKITSDENAIKETPAEKAYNRKLRLSYFFGVEALVCPKRDTMNAQSPSLYGTKNH